MIPPRTILAGIDFSDTSRTALVLAARLARHAGAALHVVHAGHPLLEAAAAHEGIDLAQETRDEVQRFVRDAPPAERCAPTVHVTSGAATEAILRTAHTLGADLLVVGNRGMTGAERLVFGSTTEGLLLQSVVAVLVAPTGWEPPSNGTDDLLGVGPVVAAVKADPSEMVLQSACALAALLHTSVEALHVVPDLAVLARWRAHADKVMASRVADATATLERRLRGQACQVGVRPRIEMGVVADRVAEAGAPGAGRAPLIVMGRGRPESLEGPGAVVYRVLSSTHAPVLMCAGT